MRPHLISLLLTFSAILSAQPANFAGIAVNAADGQPLSGVHLKVFTLNTGGAAMESYGALSGKDGRFSISGIPPGTYALQVEKTGFVHMIVQAGALPVASLTLKAGEQKTDYKLELTRRATLVVRVVDEAGDPIAGVSVAVTPATPGGPMAASLSSLTVVGSRGTNVAGEARFPGGPGKFLVKATRSIPVTSSPEIRTDGTSVAAYGPTWYPGATSAASAVPVEMAAGSTRTVEIRMVRQRSLTVGGVVTNMPGNGGVRVYLFAGETASGPRVSLVRNAMPGPDGNFQFASLPPSYYRLGAASTMQGASLQSLPVDIGPDSPDVTKVLLTLIPGAQIRGTLAIAGDAVGTSPGKRTVKLTPSSSSTLLFGTPPAAELDTDGSFKLSDVFAEKYRVTVDPLPDGGYVKAVALDAKELPLGELDFSHGAQGTVKITLGRDGAELSGAVVEKDGSPLGTNVAIVILAPDIDHITPDQKGLVSAGGKYRLTGIRPGKYLLFAIDAFRSGLSNGNEDFKKLALAAEEIEFKAGEKVVKDLKVLLKEDVDARSKK